MNNLYILIPARRGSKGAPFKNRKLLPYTLSIIPEKLKENTYVSTDDEEIINYCKENHVNYIIRPDKIASDTASTKEVLSHFINELTLKSSDFILTLYLTYPERKWEHVESAYTMILKEKAKSLLCKKEPKSSPFLCFYKSIDGIHGTPLTNTDYYRRQDHPDVFEMSHYIAIAKVSEIEKLTLNLYNKDTIFFDLENDVLDIDLESQLNNFLENSIVNNYNIDTNELTEHILEDKIVKPPMNILLLSDSKSMRNININKLPRDIIVVGLNRSWLINKPDYYYVDDINQLIEISKYKHNTIKEYRLIASNKLLTSAKSSKRFNVVKDLLRQKNLTIYNNDKTQYESNNVSSIIEIFTNIIFLDYDCKFYLGGMDFVYTPNSLIWENTDFKPIREIDKDTINSEYYSIVMSVKNMVENGYDIVSITNNSLINEFIPYVNKFTDIHEIRKMKRYIKADKIIDSKIRRKILILGNDKNLTNLDINKIPDNIITIGINRTWLHCKTDYLFFNDVDILLELIESNADLKSMNLVCSDWLVHASNNKHHRLTSKLIRSGELKLFNRIDRSKYPDSTSTAIDIFDKYIFGNKRFETMYYIYAVSLSYDDNKNHFWSNVHDTRNPHDNNPNWYNDRFKKVEANFLSLKNKGFNLISLTNNSKLNQFLDYKPLIEIEKK